MTARLSPGSTVLVTGAFGFIGSATAYELLKRGFKIRGVTRDAGKTGALVAQFDKAYGAGQFQVVEVKDVTRPDAYDEALQGVDGLIHVASDTSFGSDPNAVIDTSVAMTLNILKSAAKVPSIKSAVVTSSRIAMWNVTYGQDLAVSQDDWNTAFEELAYSLPENDPIKGVAIYAQSKVKAEQELWKWVDTAKPTFAVNTVLPDYTTGPLVNPKGSSWGTAGWLTLLFNGQTENNPAFGILQPGSFAVDVRDVAILHTAALLAPDVNHERIVAANERLDGNTILAYWREAYPDRKILPDFDFPPAPAIKLDLSRARDLVSRFAGRPMISLEQSVVDNVRNA